MKKLSLLVGGLILTGAVMAQKPADGAPMSLEGQVGLVSGAAGGTNLQFTAPSIRFRYFVAENIAVRVSLMMDNSRDENTLYENPDFSGGTGSVVTKNNGFGVGLGAEYHFAGTERLSPYAGLDIRFGGGKYNEVGDNTNNGSSFTNGDSYEGTQKYSSFGVALVAGTDYYFAENFYMGLELGLTWGSMTDKEGTYSATTGGTTTSGTYSGMSKSSMLTTNATGLFRLGWRF